MFYKRLENTTLKVNNIKAKVSGEETILYIIEMSEQIFFRDKKSVSYLHSIIIYGLQRVMKEIGNF